jgi:hypothetical protein
MKIQTLIKHSLFGIAFFFICSINAQIGIGTSTPDPSAVLDLSSTTKGLLMPRMTTEQQTALISPAIGLTVFNTTSGQLETNKGDGFGAALWIGSTGGTSGSGVAYTNSTIASSVSTNINSNAVIPAMTSTPPAGTYMVSFNGQYNVNPGVISSFITTPVAKADALSAYNQLNALVPTNTHGLAFGTAETIFPGIYMVAGAATMAGNITLNAQNDPNAIFIFKIDTDFDISALSKIILTNGAEAWNVFWVTGCVSGGAISIGESSIVKGTFLSHGAAISMQTSCVLEGRLITTAGAVNMIASTIEIPLNTSSINLGVLSTFALFSSVGAVGNILGSTITGHVGSNEGAITGFAPPATTLYGLVFGPNTDPYLVDNSIFVSFSVFKNGILVPYSTRTVVTKINKTDAFSLQVITTVEAGQAVDIRWKTNLGIITMKDRTLTLIKLQ